MQPRFPRVLLNSLAVLGLMICGFGPTFASGQTGTPPINPNQIHQAIARREKLHEGKFPSGPKAAADSQAANELHPMNWARMAFQSYRDGNWEIYSGLGDNSALVRVTQNSAPDIGPRLSPDGSQIAFASKRDGDYEIFLVNVDGSNLRQLTWNNANDEDPAWSPDGAQLVFDSLRDGNWEIYRMNADGSAQTRLTFDPGDDITPAWSPNGAKIAWGHTPVNPTNENPGEIATMNPDGSGRITQVSFVLAPTYLVYSPDGYTLGFSFLGNIIYGVYFYCIATVQVFYPVTFNDAGSCSFQRDLLFSAWTPDQENVVFSSLEYEIRNDQFWLTRTGVEIAYKESLYTYQPLLDNGVDMAADFISLDHQPPSTKVDPLPAYTKYTPENAVHLSWDSQDEGPAGVKDYLVEYRVRPGGEWSPLMFSQTYITANEITTTPAYFYLTGENVYFRVRARDYANNLEPLPNNPDYDAVTIPYQREFPGTVVDARGYPLSGAEVMYDLGLTGAARTGSHGELTSYVVDNYPYTSLGITHPGYLVLPKNYVNTNLDQEFLAALTEDHERLLGGGFENTLDPAWSSNTKNPKSYALSPYESHSGSGFFSLSANAPQTDPPSASATGQIEDFYLAQNVDLGGDLRNPTLSFFYQTGDAVGEGENLDVLINGVSLGKLPLSPKKWAHAWFDLSAYQGQKVELKLASHASADVLLDEVSVSSWTRPVLTGLTPHQVTSALQTPTLTLSGQNLSADLQVFLNEIPIPFTFVSDQQLTLSLPANLALGSYSVRVVNPQGLESFAPSNLQVGLPMYLPLISRKR